MTNIVAIRDQAVAICHIGQLGVGIYADVPMPAYLADPCPTPSMSASIGVIIDTSTAAHAYAEHPRLGNADPDFSNKADIGTAAHEALFGNPDDIVFVDAEDWRTKFAQQARDDARAEGKIALLRKMQPELMAMVSAARTFCEDAGILHIVEAGVPEQTLIWAEPSDETDPDSVSRYFRIRPDLMSYDAESDITTMLHYKTTEASANPAKFIPGIMRSMSYDFTLQFYARGAEKLAALGHAELTNCRQWILVQEQSAPYACSLIALDPAKTAIATARVNRAVATWKRCMGTGNWPAYDSRVHYAEPTSWELAASEAALRDDEAVNEGEATQ